VLSGWILFFQIFCGFEIIEPEFVEKGMKGIALSTFEGNRIDTLEVEILGRLPHYQVDEEVIIAKLKGKVVDEAGVISGMSGSPVYIEGKLLGAVAFGWSFSKEPICGITPFTEMKKMSAKKSVGSSKLTPIKPVLTIAGFPSLSVSMLDSLPFEFSVSQVALGGKTDEVTKLVPGGVCGVTLVSGDGNISAMGTITAIVGDTIFAFGHSAYAIGSSTLPLCGGKVLTYLPSYYASFNLVTPGDVIGKVVFDGDAGIKAVIGEEPPMIDCKISIGSLRKRYKVTTEESIFCDIPPFLVFSNWVEDKGVYESSTVRGKLSVWTGQGRLLLPLAISGFEVQRDLYGWVSEALSSIRENKFEGVAIDSLSIDLISEPEIKEYFIKNLIVKKNIFKPGEKITVDVVLSRYRGEDTTVVFDFEAPMDPCDLMLRLSGMNEYLEYEFRRAPLNFRFDYFKQWRDFINSMPAPDQLIFSVYKKGSSLSTDAGEFKNLPPSYRMVMEASKKRIYSDLYPLKEDKIQFDGPFRGESSEVVEVRR
jgi:hypothetical protein